MTENIPGKSPRAGRWERQPGPEPYYCFLPAPLPPNPPIQYSAELQALTEKAGRALGRLDSITAHLPNPELLLYTYIRKEAVLSSQIEGTQSSLSDLLLFESTEAPGVPKGDVGEVLNYVAALEHGVKRLKELPISLRLIREIHAILLQGGRGNCKEPGELRRSQNWIGGSRPGNARFVPPPPQEVLPALGALEKFIHGEPAQTPTLIKAGLAHAQFESIHPFLDGNGRLGRLLIPFIMIAEGALSSPLLYLSLYFKVRRAEYYEALQRVRTDGDWEGWLAFYLDGIAEVANQASDTAAKLTGIFREHAAAIEGLGRSKATALRVHDLFKKRCVLSIPGVSRELGVSFPTANKTLGKLRQLGFVAEITGKQRHRVFSYAPYLALLQEGM
ncbi:MAG TPA: cell filamentation protein Fic [Elusimicrobia bacterium]|nr:cell filamentation protein Fic [Elusimicrobiota bacterium]